MQETQVTIPKPLYERLQDEAKRHRLEVADIIQMLLEGKKQGLIIQGTRLLHDLIALAPRFRGPKNLSSTYKHILYRNGASS